jgi:SPFH domain / Band 7 family/Double zinc ribbon
MGLFTNRCVNRQCRQRVRKGSEFCPKCGTPSPKGLSICGACGTEVSRQSKFCWRCGSNIAEKAKPLILNDRWARQDGEFAVRVDDFDIKGTLNKSLIVEHGTRAMLFQAGKYKGELREGRYDLGGFLKRLNHFMADLAASVVLVDAGDVVMDIENGGLWTEDKMEVGTVERLVLRIDDADAMFVNMLKGRNRIGLGEFEEQLAGEVQMLLQGLIAGYPCERLFTDVSLRDDLEEKLRKELTGSLQRLGLELVQIRFVQFDGEAWEAHREKEAHIKGREREVTQADQRRILNERMREILTQDKMDSFKDEKDLENFIRQTEHELEIKDVIREDEMTRLKKQFQFQINREDILRRIELEGIESDAVRAAAWKELLHTEQLRDELLRRGLDRQLTEAKSDAEKREVELGIERLEFDEGQRKLQIMAANELAQRAAEHEQDQTEAQDGIGNLKAIQDVEQVALDREQEREAAALEARSKATVEALLSITDGPAADRIVGIEKLRAQEKMTPEQMLALAAEASPEAARTLAERYKNDGSLSAEKAKLLQQQLQDQRQMSESYADRMERMMQMALGQMGTVAATRAQAVDPKQTIVTPGMGDGAPVIINPQGPGTGAGQCRHCKAPLETGGGFCPQCGKKQ